MAAGRSAPRYQMLAVLYPRSQKLQSYMMEYFIIVVQLCHQMLNFTQKSTLGQLVSSLSDSEMQSHQPKLDTWAHAIKEEVDLLVAHRLEDEATENGHFRSLFKSKSAEVSISRKKKARLRVLRDCSTYDHEASWKRIRKCGTATFFLGSQEYQDWKRAKSSSTLVYSGKLGAGKSVLLANVIDDLHLQAGNQYHTIAYFFCRYDDATSLLARTVIGSLARQLLTPIQDLDNASDITEETISMSAEMIRDVLQRVISVNYRAYFVLDGLDECGWDERNEIVAELRRLQWAFTLSICVSIRQGSSQSLAKSLSRLRSVRNISIPSDNKDIEDFIKQKLTLYSETKTLVVSEPSLIDEIKTALLEHHQGMFLWVALQIESLCMVKTDAAIRKALTELPKYLPITYSRILKGSKSHKDSYQQLVLNIMIAALRPLTTEELREVLSVIPEDTDWDSTHLINDIQSTLSCCGSLVTVDEEHQTVHLVHHSVKQFLIESGPDPSGGIIEMTKANRILARRIITYLNYNIFEGQLSSQMASVSIGSIPSEIVNSTLGDSRIAQKLVKRMLGAGNKNNLDLNRRLTEAAGIQTRRESEQFHFRLYAKQYWSEHALDLSEEDSFCFDLLIKLVTKGRVQLDSGDPTGVSLLSRAIGKANFSFFRLLIESKTVNVDHINGRGDTPLLTCIRKAKEDMASYLIDNGANVDGKNSSSGRTPLHYIAGVYPPRIRRPSSRKEAPCHWLSSEEVGKSHVIVSQPSLAVAKLLIEKGAALEARDENGDTPLHLAVRHNNRAMFELLCEKGAGIEARNGIGYRPLHFASMIRNTELIRQLLKRGADVDSRGLNGETPLYVAVQSSDAESVKYLLKKGAQIHLQTRDGDTPLLAANYLGDGTILALLRMS